jgi:hypothetical protein
LQLLFADLLNPNAGFVGTLETACHGQYPIS